MAETYDLDAARAAQAEASGEVFRFTSHGTTFTVPPVTEWPIEFSSVLASGNLAEAMRLLLGDEQYRAFADGATFGDLNLIFAAIGRQQGIDLPNSSSRLQPVSTQT